MKKTLSLIISLAMIMSLAACGSGSSATETTAPAAETQAAAEETTASAAAVSDDLPEVQIKFGSVSATTHPVVQALNEVFKPRLEELSGGKITVTIYDNGSLGEESAIMEQTQLGTIQMSSVSEILTGISPKINILNLPYLFENNDEVDAILDNKEITDQLFDELPAQSLTGLGILENGFRVTTNSKKPINSLADLNGLKIRTPQTDAQIAIFTAFSANVTPLNFNELYSALQQGVVDGQENGYNTIVTQSFYEVQPYLAVTNHMWGSFSVIANKSWFDSLPAEYQDMIRQVVDETSVREREISRAMADENLQVIKDAGVEITEPDLAEFVAAVQTVYEDFYKNYPDYKPLVEKILESK